MNQNSEAEQLPDFSNLTIRGVPDAFSAFEVLTLGDEKLWRFVTGTGPRYAAEIVVGHGPIPAGTYDDDAEDIDRRAAIRSLVRSLQRIPLELFAHHNFFSSEIGTTQLRASEDKLGIRVFFEVICRDENAIWGHFFQFHTVHWSTLRPNELTWIQIHLRDRCAPELLVEIIKAGNLIEVTTLKIPDLLQAAATAHSKPSQLFLDIHYRGMCADELSLEQVDSLEKELPLVSRTFSVGHIVSRQTLALWGLAFADLDQLSRFEKYAQEAVYLALTIQPEIATHTLVIAYRLKLLFDFSSGRQLDAAAFDKFNKYITNSRTLNTHSIESFLTYLIIDYAESGNFVTLENVLNGLPQMPDWSPQSVIDASMRNLFILTRLDLKSTPISYETFKRGILHCQACDHVVHFLRGTDAGREQSTMNVIDSEVQQIYYLYHANYYRYSVDELNDFIRKEEPFSWRLDLPVLLFLRPLSALRTIFLENEFPVERTMGPLSRDKTGKFKIISFEAALREASWGVFGLTNAVGGLADPFGMVRSSASSGTTDDGWWKIIVQSLIRISASIIVLPDGSAGVDWEINELKSSGTIGKAIFVRLPAQLDWPDSGNEEAFEHYFGRSPAELGSQGSFWLGDPSSASVEILPWEAMWNGQLFDVLAERRFDFTSRS